MNFSHWHPIIFCLSAIAVGASPAPDPVPLPGFQKGPFAGEQILTIPIDPGVRIVVNAPAPESFASGKKVKLVFFALPNGNTIEQTLGKTMRPGDDWHFDIQHIAAQTRFLRGMLKDETLVVACLESSVKSWPAWRKKNGDAGIPGLLASVQKHFAGWKTETVLSGHSGGGSLLFGWLNAVPKIPEDVVRIAFLDANYAYDTALHRDKLTSWLKASDRRHFVVLAYHDDIALLNGKTFVSAAGGTWGRSHLMLKDFAKAFPFTDRVTPEWENHEALAGRVKFFLRENPEKKVLHTVQVERNGFIHALVAGTPLENQGYEYFGERAYRKFIAPE